MKFETIQETICTKSSPNNFAIKFYNNITILLPVFSTMCYPKNDLFRTQVFLCYYYYYYYKRKI